MNTDPRYFRYDTSNRWVKGNTHIHSTASDGGKSLAEIGDLYASAGYDFVFVTDHGVPSHARQEAGGSPLLWLGGVEIGGKDHTGSGYHVVCLGEVTGITPETPFPDAMQTARDQGALLVLAHPFWCGNTLEDAARWDFGGVEIYNHVCRWLSGKGDGRVHWNAMLERNPDTLAFASDDAHLRPEHPGWNGGWIVVNTDHLTEASVMASIRRGDYYSSCGPEFRTIKTDGEHVHITTSPVQFVRLVGPAARGHRLGSFDKAMEITEASLPLPAEWDYAYIEIEDRDGKRAWTNTLCTTDQPSREST